MFPWRFGPVEKGRHVLIEKPLGIDLAGTECLTEAQSRTGKFVAVAYVHHLQPALQGAREFIQSRRFGLVRHATVITGQHFPTARPAYREIYYRDHAQGGGAIQDALTHMANGVERVLGPTHHVFCDASHQVLNGVEVEDTVSVAARNGGALVTYALNQFQAPNETRLDFHAPGGSVRVELHTHGTGTPHRWRTAMSFLSRKPMPSSTAARPTDAALHVARRHPDRALQSRRTPFLAHGRTCRSMILPLNPSNLASAFSLSGKTILLTGGAGLYGRGLAAEIASAGATLILASRDEALECIATNERERGHTVHARALDQRDEASILRLRDVVPTPRSPIGRRQ